MAVPVGVSRRLASLRDHVDQVEAVLDPLRDLDDGLYDELQPLLLLEVTKLRDRLTGAAAAPDPWGALQDVKTDAVGLFTECLGFLGGAVALRSDLDAGRCRVANRLVADFRRAAHLPGPAISVPAEREYVNTMSDLIRVRFPGEGLWDLPVVAHEFGHSVCDNLGGGKARTAVHEAAATEQPKPGRLAQARAEELWSDVVATYVAGPAYAATCFRLRFDPSLAGVPDVLDTHPSPDKRAVAVLATLRRLEQRRVQGGSLAGSLAEVTADLEQAWAQELEEAGKTEPPPEVIDRVEHAAAAYYDVLDAEAPTLRYCGLEAAEAASWQLAKGRDRPAAAGIVDILNAAWLVRLRAEPADVAVNGDVATRALAWCEEVADA